MTRSFIALGQDFQKFDQIILNSIDPQQTKKHTGPSLDHFFCFFDIFGESDGWGTGFFSKYLRFFEKSWVLGPFFLFF